MKFSGILFAAALALPLCTPAAFAQDPKPAPKIAVPTTRPASTQPAARLSTKLTEPIAPDSKEMISVVVDYTEAPDAKDWAIKAGQYALKWYPQVDKLLATENFTPPRDFSIMFRNVDGVAYTQNATITVNVQWIRDHPEDIGMIAHEMVHVVQHYKGRTRMGWITEGIADYIRYYKVEPESKNRRFNPDRQDYKGGYQPSAAFLNWLEQKTPGTVNKFNDKLRAGQMTPDYFKEVTGATPDELWSQFKDSLKKK